MGWLRDRFGRSSGRPKDLAERLTTPPPASGNRHLHHQPGSPRPGTVELLGEKHARLTENLVGAA
jgi:hypothetical protein